MKKNIKILIGACIGIAVLAVAVIVLLLTAPKNDSNSSDASSNASTEIISVTADDISTLTITNDTGEYTINRLGSQKWGIDDIPEELAYTSLYSSAMTSASVIKSKMTAEENVTDFEKYGFDKPGAKIKMTFKDDKYEPVSFTLGLHNDAEDAWYFKKDGDTTVYLVSDSSVTFSQYNMLAYVNASKIVHEYDSEKDVVERVRINRKDLEKDIVFDRIPPETEKEFADVYVSYKASSHNDVLIDDENSIDTIYGLFGISASYVYALKPDKAQLSECGIDTPECVVSVVDNEDVLKLTIGNPVYRIDTDEETGASVKTITGYYGVIQGTDVIYVFPPEQLPWLTTDVESLLYRLFLTPYIYYLDDVTLLDSEKNSYKFEIKGNADSSEVIYNGQNINVARFKTFYQYLLASYAEKLYNDPLTEENKFIGSFRYHYRAEQNKTDDIVEIYSSESDRTCIFVVNGDVRYKIRQMYGTRFIENLNALLTGDAFHTDF